MARSCTSGSCDTATKSDSRGRSAGSSWMGVTQISPPSGRARKADHKVPQSAGAPAGAQGGLGMGSRGGGLTVALAAAVLGACGGDRAVTRAAEFVKAARSVRVHVQDKAGDGVRNIEIVCPDRVRVTAETTSGRLEVVAIGADAFGRTGEGVWIKVPLSFVNAPAICPGATRRPEAQDVAALLQAMTKLTVAERPIGPRQVNGVPCQDWEARDRGPAPDRLDVPRILMCLG